MGEDIENLAFFLTHVLLASMMMILSTPSYLSPPSNTKKSGASLHQLPLFCRLLGGRFDHKFSLSTTTYGLSIGELDFLIQAQLLQLGSDIGKGWELSRA